MDRPLPAPDRRPRGAGGAVSAKLVTDSITGLWGSSLQVHPVLLQRCDQGFNIDLLWPLWKPEICYGSLAWFCSHQLSQNETTWLLGVPGEAALAIVSPVLKAPLLPH